MSRGVRGERYDVFIVNGRDNESKDEKIVKKNEN